MKYSIKFLSLISTTGIWLLSANTALAVVRSNNIDVQKTENVRVNTPMVTVAPTSTPTTNPTPSLSIKARKPIEIKVVLKKTNALKEIDRRLSSLSKLSDKINAIKNISSVQKETLIAEIKIEISKLEELKTKIGSETDATALQDEKKSITESYRIYALAIPKIEIIAHADKIISISDDMLSRTTDESLQKIIANSKTKAQSAINLVLPLAPDDYPNFKTTLVAARDMLKTARINLNSVYSSLKASNPTPTEVK